MEKVGISQTTGNYYICHEPISNTGLVRDREESTCNSGRIPGIGKYYMPIWVSRRNTTIKGFREKQKENVVDSIICLTLQFMSGELLFTQ